MRSVTLVFSTIPYGHFVLSKTRKVGLISEIRFVPMRVTDMSQIPGWYRIHAAIASHTERKPLVEYEKTGAELRPDKGVRFARGHRALDSC